MPRIAAVSSLLFAAVMGVSGTASASEIFPANLESIWQVSKLPVKGKGCLLCHANELGGTGTVVQPFGKTMQAHGLVAGNVQSLFNALVYDAENSLDSDHDGVSDYTEVVADQTNPNDPNSFKLHTTPDPTNDGSGGDTGVSVEGGAGGAAGEATVRTPPLPMFQPPSSADLPPPFVHGCMTAPSSSRSSTALFGLFGLFVLVALGRRRARKPSLAQS